MRQELQIWKSEAGSRIWLSALIAAMEDASLPEREGSMVPAETLAQFRARLALPASLLYSAPRLRH
ncbi:transcriptional regulator [Bradyrhizobium sp. CCGUVB23]|uniref:transcriptional regulator n=1 Tax=Bradyrhizobium sp. CCGUVB23 TaxID=2949630 RepID=UPI0020B2DBA0|nr:transcriptional regulator [Bradyrhizobium sp. CCGUVB23]MCP3466923.1 transcriptional regulator [Bradyrhizobium sp. CCGUVB23]